jgi:hypothetical protein
MRDIEAVGLEVDGQCQPDHWRPHITLADKALTSATVGNIMRYLAEHAPALDPACRQHRPGDGRRDRRLPVAVGSCRASNPTQRGDVMGEIEVPGEVLWPWV